MEKNVIVVDEKGKELGATYPKRAKGLVKKGRARFIDVNRICLACPAEEITEDEIMSDIKIDKATGEVIENTKNSGIPEIPVNGAIPEIPVNTKNENAMPTLGYILERIDSIAKDNQYIHDALSQLSELKTAGPGDICGQSKADAISHVVDAREETNRKLRSFYEMLYKDVQCAVKSEKKIPEQFIKIIEAEEDYEARLEMFHDLCNFFG